MRRQKLGPAKVEFLPGGSPLLRLWSRLASTILAGPLLAIARSLAPTFLLSHIHLFSNQSSNRSIHQSIIQPTIQSTSPASLTLLWKSTLERIVNFGNQTRQIAPLNLLKRGWVLWGLMSQGCVAVRYSLFMVRFHKERRCSILGLTQRHQSPSILDYSKITIAKL